MVDLLHRRPWRVFVVIVVGLFASGCSSFKLLYSFADEALAREVESLLDLDDEETARVDRAVDDFFVWHNTVMLPRYARFLNAQADILDRGNPDRAAVAVAVARMRDTLDALAAGTAPFMAEVLVDHTAPGKLRYFEARMAERLAEHRDEMNAPPGERLAERVENIVDNFERFTGELTDIQRNIVRQYAEATSGDMEAWFRNRASRQRVFIEFLAQRPDEARISAFIYRIITRPQEIVDPAYKPVADAWWVQFQALLGDMMASLSAEQRLTMRDTLRGYAADMIDLSS